MQDVIDSVNVDLTHIVYGNDLPMSEADLVRCLTDPKLRAKLPNENIVYKDGNSRFPHVNRNTGATAMYMNREVLEVGLQNSVLNMFHKLYGTDEVVMTHGPPSLLTKPSGSVCSSGYVYRFQDIAPGDKFTILIPLHKGGDGIEKLKGFERYFKLLEKFLQFDKHCKYRDVLYLERWFDLDEVNYFLEGYTVLYNYYVRGISTPIDRPISRETNNFFKLNKFEVPTTFEPLTWEEVSPVDGMYIFSSIQALRTLSTKNSETRMFVQVVAEPKPEHWDESEEKQQLQTSYRTGKFGNWTKPGLRLYVRENSVEYASRCMDGTLSDFTEYKWNEHQRKVLGI